MISSKRTTPTTIPAMAPVLTPPLVTNAEVVSDADADDWDRVGAKSEDWVTVLPDVTEPEPDPDGDRLGLVLTRLEDAVGVATVLPDVVVVDWGGTA